MRNDCDRIRSIILYRMDGRIPQKNEYPKKSPNDIVSKPSDSKISTDVHRLFIKVGTI